MHWSAQNKFLAQTAILLVIVFFCLSDAGPALAAWPARTKAGRDALQSKALGGIAGAVNGYLASGSVWYFMHINDYPLTPFIEAPVSGSLSMSTVNNLPLFVLADGPGTSGDLLSLMLVGLFFLVLVLI